MPLPGVPPLRRCLRKINSSLPSLNFITLHYIYFVTTCMLSSVVFWAASTPAKSISYTDSLFVTVSAMTLAGLNTVNLSTLNTFQQFMLFFLILIGSAIFVSAFVVHVRKKAFEKRFQYTVELERWRRETLRAPLSLTRRLSRSLSRSSRGNVPPEPVADEHQNASTTIEERLHHDEPETSFAFVNKEQDTGKTGQASSLNGHTDSPLSPARSIVYRSEGGDEIQINPGYSQQEVPPSHVTFGPHVYYHAENDSSNSGRHHRFISIKGVGAHPHATVKRRNLVSETSSPRPDQDSVLATDYQSFSSPRSLSRNSNFHHLSEAEREQLGGYEYRAVRLLAWLVPAYSIMFQLLGCLGLGAYVANNKPSVARENGLNPWWVGIFNAVSAFNNSGMSLLDANMVAFQKSTYMLITMALLILAGHTCYPIFLRLTVWTILQLLPDNERWGDDRKTLQFLLDHPRRCYTNLFPARHTWWLLASVVCLNGIDWIAFEILNIGNGAITSLPAGFEALCGLFQAFAVRHGGFYVVPIPSVRISLQVLYVIMMYISVYPVVITMRNSNVYEERSLGIYSEDTAVDTQRSTGLLSKLRRSITGAHTEHTKSYFVRQQLRAQLAHDLWVIVLAVFLIMIIEGPSFSRDPVTFSVFNVIFETVSAYGCVGISIGVPDEAYSFSGGLRSLSKLVLCVVMIRGRHRGLPVAIDKAVLLPSERVDDAEEEDGEIRLQRLTSRGEAV